MTDLPTTGVLRRTPTAVLAAILLAAVRPAASYEYGTKVLVDSEEDLAELYYAGLIDEDEYQTLLELLTNPVDVNSASRDMLYDLPGITRTAADAIARRVEEQGPFKSEIALIDMPGVGDDVFEQIRPFITELPPIETRIPVRSVLTYRVGKTLERVEPLSEDHPNKTHRIEHLGYGLMPDMYLRGQTTVNRWLEAGVLVLAQEELASVTYDPETRDVHGQWGTPVIEWDKGYVAATGDHGSGIVGSYTAGFGRRLTFDVTNRQDPHGWYRDLTVGGTEQFSPPQRLFGGAARLRAIRFGRSSLDLTFMGSSRLYDIYQYHIGYEEAGEMVSPRIYVRDLDGDWQKTGYLTLPNAYREDMLGGNVTFRINNTSHVGVTGYVAHLDKTTIDGVPDNGEWLFRYRMPNRDLFGAVGIDFLLQLGMVALAGEFSRNDNGGNALLLQTNLSRPTFDLDFVMRHYDTAYDNPHNRGVSAADVYAGLRASDETGFRFKGHVRPLPWLHVRALSDLWRRPSTGVWSLQLYGKVDVHPVDQIRLAVFSRWTNKDLVNNGRTRIYGGTTEWDEFLDDSAVRLDDTEPDEWVEDGAGARTQVGGQVDIDAIPATKITLYYQRFYEDTGKLYPTGDGPCEPWFQVGNYAWIKARVKPGRLTTLTWRLKILDEDVYGGLGERSLETYLQMEQKIGRPPRPRVKLVLRLTLGRYLSDSLSEWKEDCRIAGVPQLVDGGTCLETDVGEEDDPPEEKTYGQVWGAVEFRF